MTDRLMMAAAALLDALGDNGDWLRAEAEELAAAMYAERYPAPEPTEPLGRLKNGIKLYSTEQLTNDETLGRAVNNARAGIWRSYGWGSMNGVFWIYRREAGGPWHLCEMDRENERMTLDCDATDYQDVVIYVDEELASPHGSICIDSED